MASTTEALAVEPNVDMAVANASEAAACRRRLLDTN